MKKGTFAFLKYILAIILIAFFGWSLYFGINFMALLAFYMWLFAMIYGLSDIRNRSLLVAFLVSFFVFLMGGHIVYEYFKMDIFYFMGNRYYFHSNLCLFLSLLFLIIGVWAKNNVSLGFKVNWYKKEEKKILCDFNKQSVTCNRDYIKKVAKYLFYLTFPFWLYLVVDKVGYVSENSYESYYSEYESTAPFLIRVIAVLCPYFFYLFLATLPEKKECRIPLTLYILYAGLSLFTGRRINIVVLTLFLLLYFIYRQNRVGEKELWVKKRYVILILCAMPLMVAGLYIWAFSRIGISLENIPLSDLICGFFQQQGFSSSLIRLEYYYDKSLNPDVYYSFFGTLKLLRTNIILQYLVPQDYGFSYLHNDAAFATKGNSLSNSLSYIVLGGYLNGSGLGSCYIAELYHDFRYAGVALGNFIYGYIIACIGKVWNSKYNYNIWLVAIGFSLVEAFLKAPRWNFDIIFSYLFDLGMWSAFLLVFVISSVLKRMDKNKINC